MSTIKITLSSANMGDVDETDFDIWARYVSDRIEAVAGEDAEIDQFRFGAAGEDRIEGADDEQRDTIRRWLGSEGWAEFCGQGGPWDTMRKIHDDAAA